MKTIVCVDDNWGIGSANELLYHIPDDMKFFKNKTLGNVVVMGLATLKSFPNEAPLKDRVNIVLCDDPSFTKDGVIIVSSIDELLAVASRFDSDTVYIIGGASVYAQMLPYCDTAYVTKVNASRPADKFFPNLDELPGWECVKESEIFEYDNLAYIFTEYKNSNIKE